jgi:hypothetical protein
MAWARHGMCELAFKVPAYNIATALIRITFQTVRQTCTTTSDIQFDQNTVGYATTNECYNEQSLLTKSECTTNKDATTNTEE